MKVRAVQGRRGTWTVHGFSCSQLGKGAQQVVEAPTAIEVGDVLDPVVDPLTIRFADCVAFGDSSVVAPPTISRKDTLDVKVETISSWAEENGWDVEDLGQTVILVRAHSETTETIRVVFKDNSYSRSESGYAYRNTMDVLQDLQAVLWRIAAEPGAVLDAASRRRKPLPFRESDPDDVVLDGVYGKSVKWVNSISGSVEVGRVGVPKKGAVNHVKIDTTGTGRRVLSFLDTNGTGFRAAGLDAIMEVSG